MQTFDLCLRSGRGHRQNDCAGYHIAGVVAGWRPEFNEMNQAGMSHSSVSAWPWGR